MHIYSAVPGGRRIDGALDPELHQLLGCGERDFSEQRGWHKAGSHEITDRVRPIQIAPE